jgi:hypothetical protein
MEINRSDKTPAFHLQKRDKMRSISGLLQANPIRSSNNPTIEEATQADARVLMLRNSSNPSDFVSGYRPG